MSCHSGPKQATLVLMQGQDQHGLATLVLMPPWSSYTGPTLNDVIAIYPRFELGNTQACKKNVTFWNNLYFSHQLLDIFALNLVKL